MDNYIYLDYAATTPVREEVLNEILPYFTEKFGNASSQHSVGRTAIAAVDRARAQVAKAIGAKGANEIYFTSGGTEADAFAIRGAAYANIKKGRHLITSKIEHHAVLNNFKQLEKEGFSVTYLDVDGEGKIDLAQLRSAVTDGTTLISIMAANNEVGTVQPIAEIGKIAREKKILFHTDAVQAMGSVEISVEAMNVDMLSMSAHKFYGPKGVGALYVRNGVKLSKFMIGGGQERTMRAGTHNTPGIVGLGAAIELATAERAENVKRLAELRDYFICEVEKRIPDAVLNGSRRDRLANNANFSFKYIEGESILLMLDMAGIGVSSGSACSSGSLEPSHVLGAMGVDAGTSQGTIRFTFGRSSTIEQTDYVLSKLTEIVERLRRMSPLTAK